MRQQVEGCFSHKRVRPMYLCVWISRISFYAPSPQARICSEAATWPPPRQMVYRDGILLILTPQCFISCWFPGSDMRMRHCSFSSKVAAPWIRSAVLLLKILLTCWCWYTPCSMALFYHAWSVHAEQ